MRAALRRPLPAKRPILVRDVPTAAPPIPGRPGPELARAMAAHLLAANPNSASEALRHLRQAFPASPLAVRVAALAALMRK
jgi:hypothetical protein